MQYVRIYLCEKEEKSGHIKNNDNYFFWILKCRVYFLYISHLLNNSIIGFYIFTSVGFYIFTSFGFNIFISFGFYIFTSFGFYIVTSFGFYIVTSFQFLNFCILNFFPSDFPSLNIFVCFSAQWTSACQIIIDKPQEPIL